MDNLKTRREKLIKIAENNNFIISLKDIYNRHFREISRFNTSQENKKIN